MSGCVISGNFSGLKAYGELVKDERFGKSLKSTFVFTVISVACELVLGMCLALIMNKAIKGIGIVRTTALIPWAIPTAVSALMWSYMYDGSSGIVAKIFADLGFISAPEQMLLSARGAMSAAILADVWKTTPYMALLLLAGLQIIDAGLYESATVDGAGPIRTFFSVTLPLLKPSMLVALLFRTLDAFRVYDLIAVLTGGAMTAAILADVWKTTPYMALLLLAGLQIIDAGLYESAMVDGAGPVRTFFSVTLPLLKPSMLVALLFRTLDAFRVYDLIAVLTGGAQGTETLSIYAYKLMIGQSNYGYGSAVVLAMAVCVALIAFLFVKVLGAELINDD